jgi:hypothetical protein
MASTRKTTDQLKFGTGPEKKPDSAYNEVAWETDDKKLLVDKSAFTKAVARCWDDASFSTKFTQFHPNWQKVLLAFARKVKRIDA